MKDIIKIRAEINEIEMKKTIKRSMKLKVDSLKWLTNKINKHLDSSRKKGEGSIKLEMKKKLQ